MLHLARPSSLCCVKTPSMVANYPQIQKRPGPQPFFTPPRAILHPYFFRHFVPAGELCRFSRQVRPVRTCVILPAGKYVVNNLSILLLTGCRFCR